MSVKRWTVSFVWFYFCWFSLKHLEVFDIFWYWNFNLKLIQNQIWMKQLLEGVLNNTWIGCMCDACYTVTSQLCIYKREQKFICSQKTFLRFWKWWTWYQSYLWVSWDQCGRWSAGNWTVKTLTFISAVLSLLIGIPLGTNASMSVESFLPKRNSNNGNTFQWKHDLKRKVSQMHWFALNFNIHSCLHCSNFSLQWFDVRNHWISYGPSRQRYAEYKRSRNCSRKNILRVLLQRHVAHQSIVAHTYPF